MKCLNMRKNWIAVLVLTTMVLGLLMNRAENVSAASVLLSGQYGNYSWSIDEDGVFRLTGSGNFPCDNSAYFFYDKNGEEQILWSHTPLPWEDAKPMIQSAIIEAKDFSDLGYSIACCSNLEIVDLSGTDFSECISLCSLFWEDASLKTIILPESNYSKVALMDSTFEGCSSLKSVDISAIKTSSVVSMINMFQNCTKLKEIKGLSSLNTSSAVNMSCMFSTCTSLEKIDVSSWDTSKLVSSRLMFFRCESLKQLDVSKWNTSHVTNMEGMFSECVNLEYLDLSSWDTSNVEDMRLMFGWDYVLSGEMNLAMYIEDPFFYELCFYCTSFNGGGFDVTNSGKCTDEMLAKLLGTQADGYGSVYKKGERPDNYRDPQLVPCPSLDYVDSEHTQEVSTEHYPIEDNHYEVTPEVSVETPTIAYQPETQKETTPQVTVALQTTDSHVCALSKEHTQQCSSMAENDKSTEISTMEELSTNELSTEALSAETAPIASEMVPKTSRTLAVIFVSLGVLLAIGVGAGLTFLLRRRRK